nr:MAG: hypothetical protein H2Bulk351043_000002 [Mitovirus sp.]
MPTIILSDFDVSVRIIAVPNASIKRGRKDRVGSGQTYSERQGPSGTNPSWI